MHQSNLASLVEDSKVLDGYADYSEFVSSGTLTFLCFLGHESRNILIDKFCAEPSPGPFPCWILLLIRFHNPKHIQNFGFKSRPRLLVLQILLLYLGASFKHKRIWQHVKATTAKIASNRSNIEYKTVCRPMGRLSPQPGFNIKLYKPLQVNSLAPAVSSKRWKNKEEIPFCNVCSKDVSAWSAPFSSISRPRATTT